MFKRMSLIDKVYVIMAYLLVLFIVIITAYPIIYIVSASISNQDAVVRGEIWLLPKGINFGAYKIVTDTAEIWRSYANTIWYVVVGTIFSLFMTTITAYPLSRKKFAGRNLVMLLIAFTMFFSGGLIPSYLLVKSLNLINHRLALIIPGALSAWNIILMRTFFQSLPEEMFEAAHIDGCSEIKTLSRIVLPLSKPIIAVMVLFFAVGQWNSFFGALIYLNDTKLYPLQMVLRKILIQYDSTAMLKSGGDIDKLRQVGECIRYATIVVATLPILCVYPFLQKYFVQGVMIGAIKG